MIARSVVRTRCAMDVLMSETATPDALVERCVPELFSAHDVANVSPIVIWA